MDSLSSVSLSMVLPPSNLFHRQTWRIHLFSRNPCSSISRLTSVSPKPHRRHLKGVSCNLGGGGGVKGEDDDESEEFERALPTDGTIHWTSDEFLRQVSSRAYDMRRHIQQSFDSSSYDCTVALVFPPFSLQLSGSDSADIDTVLFACGLSFLL